MSLGVAIKGPEGVVLAADSRVTIAAQQPGGPQFFVNFDNASKLLSFSEPHNFVGAVTYGQAIIGRRTAHSFIPEFEVHLAEKSKKSRLGVEQYAEELSKFFMDRWTQAEMPSPKDGKVLGMNFLVGGYDANAAYGKVFLFVIPSQPDPEPRNPDDFGMSWGGQLEVASRIIHGFDPALLGIVKQQLDLKDEQVEELRKVLGALQFTVPYEVLPLQDCVDLATFLVRTTMTAQGLAIGVRGVGGPIEVATVTKTSGLQFVQRKKIHGESGTQA